MKKDPLVTLSRRERQILDIVHREGRATNDDAYTGRVLTRREVLGLLGAGPILLGGWSRALAGGESLPGCVVRPQQTEGPFFVDEALNRSDIRSDPGDGAVSPGTRLDVAFKVSRIASNGCAPLAGAHVDVWHCDALGIYSDVEDPDFDTSGKKFLRGYQVTDTGGLARFTTIYPGWYGGRTVHVHFKIRSAPSSKPGFEFTSQLYFDDALTDKVHSRAPYQAKGRRDVRNSSDGVFERGGKQLMLDAARVDRGYSGTFEVALLNR